MTPGAYDTRTLVDRIGMPEDLSGLSVLDIGAWDGYISFEAERRGARRVLATDSYVWRNNIMNNISSGKAGFQFARAALNCDPEDAQAAANLAVVLAKRGQSQAAIDMLEESLRKNHSDPALRATIEQSLAQCRAERMRAEVGKIQWWHSIDLGTES